MLLSPQWLVYYYQGLEGIAYYPCFVAEVTESWILSVSSFCL